MRKHTINNTRFHIKLIDSKYYYDCIKDYEEYYMTKEDKAREKFAKKRIESYIYMLNNKNISLLEKIKKFIKRVLVSMKLINDQKITIKRYKHGYMPRY